MIVLNCICIAFMVFVLRTNLCWSKVNTKPETILHKELRQAGDIYIHCMQQPRLSSSEVCYLAIAMRNLTGMVK